MYDHLGLHVSNLARSVAFYEAALAALGFEKDSSGTGFGPPGEPGLWLYAGERGGAAHVAFRATTRAAVDAFHRRGLAAGGKDNGAPGVRTDYSPTYYAAFLIDPDGHNVEAVCLEAP